MYTICVLLLLWSACAYAQGTPDTTELTNEVRKLGTLVSDLVVNNQRMEKEIHQLKQTQQILGEKVTSQELENAALKKQLDSIHDEGIQDAGKDKRFVMSNEGPHVAFTVYLDHPLHNMTSNQIIVYNQVLFNQGSAYDEKTGIFTAPYSGVYLFSYSIAAKAIPGVVRSQYDIFTKLVINGDHQISAVAESLGTYDDEQSSNTAVLYVDEASQVWTAHQVRGGSSLYSTDEERMAAFTGVLLYAT